MSSSKQQGLIEAPLQDVWAVLEDPQRFAEWNEDTVEVTGVPTEIEKGSTFQWKTRGPLGISPTSTFEVEEVNDLREIKLRCRTSGYYSHWVLTEARGSTFAELEMGIDPPSARAQAFRIQYNRLALRRMALHGLDNLRSFLRHERGPEAATGD